MDHPLAEMDARFAGEDTHLQPNPTEIEW